MDLPTLTKEVKASRKEKGRDTLGCPVFLRPLPGHLLASFRDLEQPEPGLAAEEAQPAGPPSTPWQLRLRDTAVPRQGGALASAGGTLPGVSPYPAAVPQVAPISPAVPSAAQTVSPHIVIGPSFWI